MCENENTLCIITSATGGWVRSAKGRKDEILVFLVGE